MSVVFNLFSQLARWVVPDLTMGWMVVLIHHPGQWAAQHEPGMEVRRKGASPLSCRGGVREGHDPAGVGSEGGIALPCGGRGHGSAPAHHHGIVGAWPGLLWTGVWPGPNPALQGKSVRPGLARGGRARRPSLVSNWVCSARNLKGEILCV